MISAEHYTDNSIAVFGDTKTWKDELKNLGGRYNPSLRGRAGWIFPKTKEQELVNFVAQINSGNIKPQPQHPPQYQQPLLQPVPLNFNQPSMHPTDAFKRLSLFKPLINEESKVNTLLNNPLRDYSINQRELLKQPTTNVQTFQSNLTFPNVFTAADGFTYQIIMITTIVPVVGQTLSIAINDTSTDYQISAVKTTYPFDNAVIKNDSEEFEINIVNGQWKIKSITDEHSITFQPYQS